MRPTQNFWVFQKLLHFTFAHFSLFAVVSVSCMKGGKPIAAVRILIVFFTTFSFTGLGTYDLYKAEILLLLDTVLKIVLKNIWQINARRFKTLKSNRVHLIVKLIKLAIHGKNNALQFNQQSKLRQLYVAFGIGQLPCQCVSELANISVSRN